MSFSTALSGLQASSSDISVISNNIANVSTTGFKYSRTEFSDLFEISPFGNSPTAVGGGVQVAAVSQQFKRGNTEDTDSTLDLAITGGSGFFIMDQSLTGDEITYTQAGQFGADADGYIVNSSAQYLQVFPVDSSGRVISTSLSDVEAVQLPASTGAPQASTQIEVGLQFDSAATPLDPANFDPTAIDTFSNQRSAKVFDSLGASHIVSYFFVRDELGSATNPDSVGPPAVVGDPNQWVTFTYLDGVEVDIDGGADVAHTNNGVAVTQKVGIIRFNADGSYNESSPALLQNLSMPLGNGSDPISIVHDFANNGTTQFSGPYATNILVADGFTSGELTGLEISETGLLQATFSNGTALPLGQVALANFPNVQGLKNKGSASWVETTTSGAVITNMAGVGGFGLIKSGSLEASNVNLTKQLVNLITAQRNFQANAKSIETSKAITDTIIQIR